MYIDVHCHLTGDEYAQEGGARAVLDRAKAAGVARVICSGFDLQSSKIAMQLAQAHEEVYFCAGFHPSELDKYNEGDVEEIARLCAHPKCVAVGEIGLDYHYENNPAKETQKHLFLQQLRLADSLGLPVVLHSRDAAEDTLLLLEANKHLLSHGGLMHCYSYSPEMAERFLGLGLCFSFGGPCTFKNAKKAQESVRRIPAPHLLSETDCPYLTPEPHRGTFPNQPMHVVHVVEKLAQLKEMDVEQMQRQLWQNAKRLFGKLDEIE